MTGRWSCTCSALLLILWVCVLLASASASQEPPKSPGQIVQHQPAPPAEQTVSEHTKTGDGNQITARGTVRSQDSSPHRQRYAYTGQGQSDDPPEQYFFGLNTITLTGLIALGTFILALIYGYIALVMRNTMLLADRPYVTAKDLEIYEWKAPHTADNETDRWQLAIRLHLANYGKSPAQMRKMINVIMMDYWDQLQNQSPPYFHEEDIDKIAGLTVPGGKTEIWEHSGPLLTLSVEEMGRYREAGGPAHRNLFIVGFVAYEDTHKKIHESHFAFGYINTQPPRVYVVQNQKFWKHT